MCIEICKSQRQILNCFYLFNDFPLQVVFVLDFSEFSEFSKISKLKFQAFRIYQKVSQTDNHNSAFVVVRLFNAFGYHNFLK